MGTTSLTAEGVIEKVINLRKMYFALMKTVINMNSKLIWECFNELNTPRSHSKVWVPCHIGLESAESEDYMARKEAGTQDYLLAIASYITTWGS